MPRAYTVATAALTLGVSFKWVDNTLSHHSINGVVQEKQGVSRQLTIDALLTLSITLLLSAELGSSVRNAIGIAEKIIAQRGVLILVQGLRIELDLDAFRGQLLSRLEHAVEAAPLPRRGRPPKSTTGRLE